MDKIKLSPNPYENNLLLGGTCAYAPAESGCKVESIPAGWSVEQELANWKVLKPEGVGPAWVIALRKAGQFAIEDDKACFREEAPQKEKKQKKKKKKD